MLDTSWKATDLVQPVWKRLNVPKGHREELARLTGIPATNLSGLNTGRLAMTRETAERIAAAVDGVTVADLGAPAEEDAEQPASLPDRLERVEGDLAEALLEQAKLSRRVTRLQVRVRRIEAQSVQRQAAGGP